MAVPTARKTRALTRIPAPSALHVRAAFEAFTAQAQQPLLVFPQRLRLAARLVRAVEGVVDVHCHLSGTDGG